MSLCLPILNLVPQTPTPIAQLSATKRAMITRGVALCPTMLFAFASPGMMDALNQWINILQSVQLPFAVVPVS